MNAKERKERPVFTGVLKYFPDAIMEVARVSLQGNKQHHPDKPLHWDRSKSTDDYASNRAQFSTIYCWPMRSTAPRQRYKLHCWKQWKSDKSQ